MAIHDCASASTEAALVPVQLSPERLQSIGVKTGHVERKIVEDEIRVTGNVAIDETRLAYVQVRYSGYIQKVFADATYQYLRKGQPLFTIYSPDLVATEREYLVAKQNQQRVAESTVPGVTESAASLLEAAKERLKQWGVPAKGNCAGSNPRAKCNRNSKSILPSPATLPNAMRCRISLFSRRRGFIPSPTSRLFGFWPRCFRIDLGRIKVGDRATLTVDSYPGRTFEGRVNFIYPQVDMTTRTARARLVFSNPGLKLTPGMFVNVVLKVPMGKQFVIPASGVLQSGTRQVVFVEPRRRLHRTARSATRRARRRRFRRAERIESRRGNCHLRELPDRLRKPATGGARFVRSSSTRRGCGMHDERSTRRMSN